MYIMYSLRLKALSATMYYVAATWGCVHYKCTVNKNKRIYIKKVDTLCVNVSTRKYMVTVQQCGEIVGNMTIERNILKLDLVWKHCRPVQLKPSAKFCIVFCHIAPLYNYWHCWIIIIRKDFSIHTM